MKGGGISTTQNSQKIMKIIIVDDAYPSGSLVRFAKDGQDYLVEQFNESERGVDVVCEHEAKSRISGNTERLCDLTISENIKAATPFKTKVKPWDRKQLHKTKFNHKKKRR